MELSALENENMAMNMAIFIMLCTHHLDSSANLSISIGTELNGLEFQGTGDSGLVSMKSSCENNPGYLGREASGEIN